ncbi:MAG: hypothetical protein FWG40_03895 [Peptococcaceae bacterium]|nr:hypothetical protein [Peptococcaceae bacterium]
MDSAIKKGLVLVLAMVMLLAFTITASAANGNNGNNGNSGNGNGNGNGSSVATEETVYLKGSGSSFKEAGWQNVFKIEADYAGTATPETWHLVYSGKNFNSITSMQITFTNGEQFEWTPDMGPSVNGGGNNMGWVIVAPYGWEIAYENKGNNNESESFLKTTEAGNVNFNISGYNPGTPKIGSPKGSISLVKTVEGVEITAWVEGTDYGIADLIEGFYLYKVDADRAPIEGLTPVAKAILDGDVFTFGNLDDGWYAIEEVLTEEGEKVFEQADVMYLLIANGVTYGGSVEFDYDAFYTIVNGHGSGYVLGYPGLNNTGDIFPIGVTNTDSGEGYASFCANAGSRAFAGQSGLSCVGYLVAERMDRDSAEFADFVKAFNYIEDTFEGSLADNRAITQIVTWYLLGAIEYPSGEFDSIDWAAIEAGKGSVAGITGAKAAVEDVLNNYKNHSGSGKIVDVVYMICEHGHDYSDCQPQLVPIYGKTGFENKLQPLTGELAINASVELTITLEKIIENWQREITPYRENTQWLSPSYSSVTATTEDQLAANESIVKNSNHFTFAKLNVTDLLAGESIPLTLVEGNKLDKVGEGSVIYNGGKLEVSFNDAFSAAKFGVLASDTEFAPTNGNVHSQNDFNHNNKAVLDLTLDAETDVIYLYVHFDNLKFDYGINIGEGEPREWEDVKEYKVDEKSVSKTLEPRSINVDIMVYDSEGNLVEEDTWNQLQPGTYQATFTYYNPIDKVSVVETEDFEIVAGETTVVDFSESFAQTIDLGSVIKWLPDITNELVETTIIKIK